jgi:hypothetical protein
MPEILPLESERLILRAWRDEDLPAFAALNADPQVMRYFPAIMTPEQSHAQANKFRDFMQQHSVIAPAFSPTLSSASMSSSVKTVLLATMSLLLTICSKAVRPIPNLQTGCVL